MAKLIKIIKNLVQKSKFVPESFKKKYTLDNKQIEIDITYRCNMGCNGCDRVLDKAPTNIDMSVDQIQSFVNELYYNNNQLKRIKLLGGEPTLHPELQSILEILTEYSSKAGTKLQIATNGTQPLDTITKFPNIGIINSAKKSPVQDFYPFNISPIDTLFKYSDFSIGCRQIETCGVGMNAYGFYPCTPGAAIDRVFGFNIGRKEYPHFNNDMTDQLEVLCKHCGHFWAENIYTTRNHVLSQDWQKAISDYKHHKPVLDRY